MADPFRLHSTVVSDLASAGELRAALRRSLRRSIEVQPTTTTGRHHVPSGTGASRPGRQTIQDFRTSRELGQRPTGDAATKATKPGLEDIGDNASDSHSDSTGAAPVDILPFRVGIPTGDQEAGQAGGFGRIFRAPLYDHVLSPSHSHPHSNQEPVNYVAVKQLESQKGEYEREVAALKKFKSKNIVNLLASYKKGDRSYLLFPWADGGNLRQFWEKRPDPQPSLKLVSWMAEQCTGLLSALEMINGKTKRASSSESIQPSSELYGLHGDIKPENILWFGKDPSGGDDSSGGVLKISDFGLARFSSRNGLVSRSLGYTPTYRNPEFELQDRRTSENSDIWSLGCVFLEFISWYLLGWDATENQFVDLRLSEDDSTDSESKDDKFFNMVKDPSTGSLGAVIKPSVTEWIRRLRDHPNCSGYLVDLLDLVENQMLCIDPDKRASSETLRAMTDRMYHKGLLNPDYFLPSHPATPVSSDRTVLTSQLGGKPDVKTGASKETEPNLPFTMLKSVDAELKRTEDGPDEQQDAEDSQSPIDVQKQKQAKTGPPDSPADPISISDEIADIDSRINAVSWLEWPILSVQRLIRPRLQMGYRRVEWRCSCGSIQYTDFENSNPQAVQRLARKLRRMYAVHNVAVWELPPAHLAAVPGAASGSTSPSSSATVTTPALAYQFGSHQMTGTTRNDRLASGANSGPSRGQFSVDNSPSNTQSPQQIRRPPPTYIELCINTGKRRLRLAEIRVDDSFTDGMLFSEIWREYHRFRSRSDWLSWLRRIFKKPVDVHWVNFGLPSKHPELVDIWDRPNCIPPEDEVKNKRYEYQECPMNPLPPMKFNNFYHYLKQARQDAKDPNPRRYMPHRYSTWFKRFPKRIGSVHDAPKPATFVSGWGVYIVEGVRKTAVFCVLLFLFAVGISVGVIYAAAYKTSEQGWGIAAVLTAFLFAVIGSVYTYWDEEYS